MTNEQLKAILINSKWEVTPEQSAYLQQRALEVGYWSSDRNIQYTECPYLYFYYNELLSYGKSYTMFNIHAHTLRIFSDIFPEFGKEISEGKEHVIESEFISIPKAEYEELKKAIEILKTIIK